MNDLYSNLERTDCGTTTHRQVVKVYIVVAAVAVIALALIGLWLTHDGMDMASHYYGGQ